MNDPKTIISLITISVAVFLYLWSQVKNECKRPKDFIGYICPRCRQGFEKSDLFPVWQFPTAPLRLLGWNKEQQFDLCYCRKCRYIVNFYLILSVLISLPIVMMLIYLLLMALGLVAE